MSGALTEADPFDLPDWVGPGITWAAAGSVRGVPEVAGELRSEGGEVETCHLLAVDRCYPVPAVDDSWRTPAHRAWHDGQVLLVRQGGVLTLAVPGASFSPDLVLEAIARLARAVGADPVSVGVLLRA